MGKKIVLLTTGGTIAGLRSSDRDAGGYRVAQLSVSALLAQVPQLEHVLAGDALVGDEIAQIDSKDMPLALWRALALRVAHELVQPDVRAVVLTHGTDTLEETAWFLQQVLAPVKPVVLTGAMRPADAPDADGPRNLYDAVRVAREDAACGVMAVMAGGVHAARALRKLHPTRMDAFSSGEAGPLAAIDAQGVHWRQAPGRDPQPDAGPALSALPDESWRWPWVAVVQNMAGADGREVDALCAAGVRGLIAAGTGNGTLAASLEAALRRAQATGVRVVRSSRCPEGAVQPAQGDPFEAMPGLSPVKARISLMLSLLATAGDKERAPRGPGVGGGA